MYRSKPFRLGRRSFIRLTAAGTAGLYVAGCGGEPVERAQALVIGTGFGGSIAALRLAEAGVSVTMLERGRRWELTDSHDTFTTTQNPDGRAAWMSREPVLPGLPPTRLRMAPYVGLLQKLPGANIDVVCAAGVGGGSLVYSGMMLQPPRALFESAFPSGIDYTEMDARWYPMVRDIMRPSAMPDDIYEDPHYVSSRLFIRDAEAAGLDVERLPVAFDWDKVRGELTGEYPEQAILGDYLYGLNSGAKHSIDRVGYLAMAEATGMVEVKAQHQVTAIGEGSEGGYRVDVERIDEHGEVVDTVIYEADMLFLGAGSMNTTKLLLQAKRDGTLPNLNDQIGERWGNNGQRILARGGLAEETGATQGGPACIFIHHHDNPEGPIGMEFGAAPIGFEHHCLISATQGVPDELGRLVLGDDGEVTADWDRSYDASAGRAARHTMQTIIDAAGGEHSTVMGQLDDPSITFHPLGGATLGGACDLYGRVQGHPSLYVVDSSLIPGTTPAGNPFWTIAAMAERCMSTIVADDLNPDD